MIMWNCLIFFNVTWIIQTKTCIKLIHDIADYGTICPRNFISWTICHALTIVVSMVTIQNPKNYADVKFYKCVMEEIPSFINASHGEKKLIFRGFMYLWHRKIRYSFSSRCEARDSYTTTITTSTENEGAEVLKEKDHTHAPDWGSCHAAQLKEQMKERSVNSVESAASLVQNVVQGASSETIVKLL